MLLLIIFIFNLSVLLSNAKLPESNQIIYVNSSEPIVIKPSYMIYSNNLVPEYYINLAYNNDNNNDKNNLSGNVFQVSTVYSNYGYNPAQGKKITNSTKIFDKFGRFVYLTNNSNHKGLLDKINIKITNPNLNMIFDKYIYILPKSGIIVSSDFLFGIDNWTIVGSNPLKNNSIPTHNKYSSKNMSYFITWIDDYINVDSFESDDKALWYFRSGEKFKNNLEISYGGNIQFMMTSFSGNFSNLNNINQIPFVKIYCKNQNNILVYYYRQKINLNQDEHNGLTKKFNIKLDNLEWKKISIKTHIEDNLTKEEFISCLKNVSHIDILGDWTRGIETIGLDSVIIMKK